MGSMNKRNGKWVTNMAFTDMDIGIIEAAKDVLGLRDNVSVVCHALRVMAQKYQISGAPRPRKVAVTPPSRQLPVAKARQVREPA